MMHEVTFPEAASATAALVGWNAAVAVRRAEWPSKQQSYFVHEAVPTVSFFESCYVDAADEEFAREIASLFAALSEGQKRLGAEFEAVWDSNVHTLYES